jgi:two-component system, NarL family, invasion response regulator UvrY
VADEPVSVLIVDDQAPFRSAARAVVAMTSGFAVVGEAASGEEALELVESSGPDVVLMDINMPGINGIETSRRITAGHPQTVVVLLSTYAADELPADARDCGAATYVNKEEFGPDVLEQLRRRLEDGRDA